MHDWIIGDDGFHNMFVYQPTLDTLELKQEKGTDYIIGWKSKGVYTSQLKPLHISFLHSIKFMDIQWE